MSSRAFKARTTHSSSSPQLCGLHRASGCSHEVDGVIRDGAIVKDQLCFYLTCLGRDARPERQIQKSNKADGYASGYRIVPDGWRKVGRPGHERQVRTFKWQEERGGRWHDVTVWERMVHVECAAKLGYKAPGRKTSAHKGERTKGYAHQVEPEPISVLEELAVVALDPEELQPAERKPQ